MYTDDEISQLPGYSENDGDDRKKNDNGWFVR